jgi:Arm DNA-binding domain
MPLTDTAIRGTKPNLKPFKMYDRNGLFLLVNPSGSKLWRWRYRFDNKEKLMALGEYPVVGLSQVRELQLAARRTLIVGIDPMENASRKRRPKSAKPKRDSAKRKIASRE